jgi:predicted nucleotidyltransferase
VLWVTSGTLGVVLVEKAHGPGLVAELEELLGRRVQVVTERGLDELLRDRVLEEAVRL